MTRTVTEESFAWLTDCWRNGRYGLRWDTPFVLPPWLRVWRRSFAAEDRVSLRVVQEDGTPIGVGPLLIRDSTASIIGHPELCDYADVIVAPGREEAFCRGLLDHLVECGITTLDLHSLRPDSAAFSWLVGTAERDGHRVSCQEEAVSLECDLPDSWDEYLQLLSSKQRHEVKRKIRRWQEAGEVGHRFVEGEEPDAFLDAFLRLFVASRDDKAEFMTPTVRSFFRSLTEELWHEGLLRAGLLELDGQPVAATLGFEYDGVAYLYNSALDPEYRSLSVGVISKALYIKDSIARGLRRFDFLKGTERYKYHLGGQEVHLHRCVITIVRE